MSKEARCQELLQQAHALLRALMQERDHARLVNLPPAGATLRAIEKDALLLALERSYWRQCDAAAMLGISDRVMSFKVRRHNIQTPRNRGRPWTAPVPQHDPR